MYCDDNKCMFKEKYWAKLEFQENWVDGGLIKKPMWEDMYMSAWTIEASLSVEFQGKELNERT